MELEALELEMVEVASIELMLTGLSTQALHEINDCGYPQSYPQTIPDAVARIHSLPELLAPTPKVSAIGRVFRSPGA